jgi:2-phospho-L-lactate transferase/gluconeogenesis factor (CofD/UPF0052 family)
LRGLADAMGPVVERGHGVRAADTLSAIVTVTDDGGSSGRLRRDLGVLRPGDVRNCLAALTGNAVFERLLTQAIVNLIVATTTRTGLRVKAALDTRRQEPARPGPR